MQSEQVEIEMLYVEKIKSCLSLVQNKEVQFLKKQHKS